ncbi:MAG TPA: DSD1 family PLP-dependent enzyme, partial [Stellaceae bacterium]|nr:DSD1 family PLP-dependent enzyme [Stellaceae bacterium]
VGSYVFMDVDYQNALKDGRNAPPFETALFVATAVVSANVPGYVTCDAGLKAFATDGPAPEAVAGAPAGSRYAFFGDEHGKLVLPAGAAKPPLGAIIECVTPHCDPTVNLHDVYHLVRGDTLVDIWPVDARGKR